MSLFRPALAAALAAVLLASLTSIGRAQSTNAGLQLRLAPSNNRVELFLEGNAPSGALFIYQSSDPRRLAPCPPVVVQTNTPLTNGLRFSLPLSTRRFFQAVHWPGRPILDFTNQTMAYVPAGAFAMGDTLFEGPPHERPVHTVQVSGFWMDKYEVSFALWDDVRLWAEANGYSFDTGGQGKAPTHPVHSVSWFDAVKWCNARSEKEGRQPAYYTNDSLGASAVYRAGKVVVQNDWVNWEAGYRLPTEAEWEKAARGGAGGLRFPCKETIAHSEANYYSSAAYEYDLSPSREHHPSYGILPQPYTSPVGAFAPSGYGLYDMAGNLQEWCWDAYDSGFYAQTTSPNPRGVSNGVMRVFRGGSWNELASRSRVAFRSFGSAGIITNHVGFRTVLPTGPYAAAPVVLIQPQDRTNQTSSTADFSVTVAGAGPLRIQWRRSGVALAWATNRTLILPNVQPNQAGSYDLVVENAYGSVTSRVATLTVLSRMVFIPEGIFQMGDESNRDGDRSERPIHLVSLKSFYMDRIEVTKTQWDEVYLWALTNGYVFDYGARAKAANHPVHSVSWNDALKWCNARSEKEGIEPAYYTSLEKTNVYRYGALIADPFSVKWTAGYRLPTEAEWEKAARGGVANERFGFGTTISHAQANYYSVPGDFDINPWCCFHPSYWDEQYPFTSPAGSFAPNGYGLYDMVGNLEEWCWDWFDANFYNLVSPPGLWIDPVGPFLGLGHVLRGGGWGDNGWGSRSAARSYNHSNKRADIIGFRTVLPPGQPPAIAEQPVGRTNVLGTTASFGVTATGTWALSYQWRWNGANVSGGTNTILTLANVQTNQEGNYDVVVANGHGSVTSSVAVLTVVLTPPVPSGMVLIPAGSFAMGDTFSEGFSDELPVHTVTVGAFYMDRTEATKAKWDEVYGWAVTNGYSFEAAAGGKASTHPAHSMTWYEALKWCNARSEKEGRVPAYYTDATLGPGSVYRSGQVNVQNDWVRWTGGYRLPTEAEWEKAARGGVAGQRFGFGDTITHGQANYYSDASYAYDVSVTGGYHPTYAVGGTPYTSPVGSFGTNGYGLYDMVGNVWEWCWDWYGSYSSSPAADPQGPTTGSGRVLRGGSWNHYAYYCRSAYRDNGTPGFRFYSNGFRAVLPLGQP